VCPKLRNSDVPAASAADKTAVASAAKAAGTDRDMEGKSVQFGTYTSFISDKHTTFIYSIFRFSSKWCDKIGWPLN